MNRCTRSPDFNFRLQRARHRIRLHIEATRRAVSDGALPKESLARALHHRRDLEWAAETMLRVADTARKGRRSP